MNPTPTTGGLSGIGGVDINTLAIVATVGLAISITAVVLGVRIMGSGHKGEPSKAGKQVGHWGVGAALTAFGVVFSGMTIIGLFYTAAHTFVQQH